MGEIGKETVDFQKRYDRIVSSDVYRETISSGTSGRNEIERRLRSVYEQLSEDDSENS